MSSSNHPVGGTTAAAAATNTVINIEQAAEDPTALKEGIKVITSSPGVVNAALGWVKAKIIQPVRESKLFQSRAFQITLLVLGILLVVAGLACMFIFHSELGANAFWLIIPAVVGLIKLLVTSLCFDEVCTSDKLVLFQKWAGVLEDQFDDGILNQSNKIFGHVKSESKTGSRASSPVLGSLALAKSSSPGPSPLLDRKTQN
ncbi:cysteine-rich outer membrane protein [Candidatus Chlamydia corallus]|uniref:cysteine-rich outer membrane protein n=1 Tax=Candidatus Chlamydia corallus TaxID=2038470 RepID=UPI000C2FDB2C|nr:cysteine-rich outer membrane protein [Candidatus Chlamydia corallus]